ncbi:MAG TPA: DNA polymerase I [Vicinamibacterales bacterium]|nr:DNA polymerase I [Vicinamibacterales bacterium]
MPRLFLIDGSSQMYRAYHAIRGLTGPDGRSTNAVYGFATMLRKLIADHQPEYLAASFDLAGPTFRDELAADYKANRAPMPSDLAEQVPLVREACEALGVPVLTSERFEADDVIGTLAMQAHAAGFEIALVTGDKDFFQLVGDGIRVYNPRDEGTWYDAEGVIEKFGVRPDQVVDVLALMGDSIDNIKGVPGIGEKGARELIAAHGSLDALLEAAPTIAQKRYRQALAEHADSARSSRELARIRTDVPVTFDADALHYRGPSRERCYALFSSLGFRSLVQEYAPTAESAARDYGLISSLEEIDALAAEIAQSGRAGLATIGGAESAAAGDTALVGLAIAPAPGRARYIPLGHSGLAASNLPVADVVQRLAPVLADPNVEKIGHDLKATSFACAQAGIEVRGTTADTMVMSYLLDATRSSHDLDGLALERAGYRTVTREALAGKGAKAVALDAVPAEAMATYASERADLPLTLAPGLTEDLELAGLTAVYRDLERPLIPVLADIERAGIRVDTPALAALGATMQQELDELCRRIYGHAGCEFNINSPKQLADVLFGTLQLQSAKKTGKTRAVSTAREVLEELALVHELPALVLRWREIQKLKGTYVDALPGLVNPSTGRVHTTFNQAVAATGRLSSSDPNLQNIPIRTALGREIRAAFVAEPGYRLISADYSQIELRVLAHLSGDDALREAFQQDVDIHDLTAERVFGGPSGPLRLDPHELRRRAKIINYALLYGKTAFTLAKDIGVPQQQAQEFIDAYFAGYPAVRTYIDHTLADARTTGVVRTLLGRRRLVPEISSKNGQIRAAAEREAVNMPIQGTAADILKQAMIDVHAALAERNAGRPRPTRMILTVHDELVFETPEDDADEAAAFVKGLMERAFPLSVPLTVDVGIGSNWNEAKP